MKRRWIIKGLALALALVLGSLGCKGFDEQLILNQAERCHDSGNFEEAIRLYTLLIERDPENKVHPDKGFVRYELGMAYLDSGNRPKAKEQIETLKKMSYKDLAEALSQEMLKQGMK